MLPVDIFSILFAFVPNDVKSINKECYALSKRLKVTKCIELDTLKSLSITTLGKIVDIRNFKDLDEETIKYMPHLEFLNLE